MSDLETVAQFLSDSIVAATAKSAERRLRELETQDGFGLTLLHVVASTNLPIATRLAGALFFKNFIKRKWIDEDGNYLIPIKNVELIKAEIVPLMITLPNNLQVQIGEAISVIADSDFPAKWPNLLEELVTRLSADDMVTNKGVLTVAHSIFKKWRPLFRSDELFLEIKMVLDVFTVPYLKLLKNVDEKISQSTNDAASLNILFEVLLILIKLYYDFNCQDIPEFFEDNLNAGMGILHKYLVYKNPLMDDPEEDTEVSILLKVQASIQEVVQLYTTRYADVFEPLINEFIQVTWNLLTSLSNQPKYDILISKSLSFLTAVTKIPASFEVFNNQSAMENLTEQIILPNVMLRETDVELFEDDPIEYIRRDLEGTDTDTRRRGCTNFLKELKQQNEVLVTNILLEHIKKFFLKYQENSSKNWKCKDLCIYLFTALAVNGSITASGVSSTNSMVDVIEFFTKNVMSDLTDAVPHPILRIDAIKYIYVFRNQLNKAQLINLMPILAGLLNSNEYVEFTYAAIVIERVLSMRESISTTKLIFTKDDLSGSAQILLSNLLELVSKQGNSPEKLAENEFLMKAINRVLQTSEDSISQMFPELMLKLLGIIDLISKNPSNPRFTHFTFEAIGTILSFTPVENIPQLPELIMGSFMPILSEDIQEFIPYVFQIIAYSVEKNPTVSNSFKDLAQPLLSPVLWESNGTIPAVTRLLKSLIKADQTIFPDLVPVLGVFQRLIASKAHDIHGFELLESIFLSVDLDRLNPFLKQIAVLLLQRLQNSKTDRFVKKLNTILGVLSVKLGPDFVVQFIDSVQDGIFNQIWSNFIIPILPNIGNLLDRKIALIGTITTIKGQLFQSKYSTLLPGSITALVETTCSESIANMKNDFVDLENLEEISTFGSSYSKLSSIAEKPYDPMPEVDATQGVKMFVAKSLLEYMHSSSAAFNTEVVPNLSNETQMKLNQLISG